MSSRCDSKAASRFTLFGVPLASPQPGHQGMTPDSKDEASLPLIACDNHCNGSELQARGRGRGRKRGLAGEEPEVDIASSAAVRMTQAGNTMGERGGSNRSNEARMIEEIHQLLRQQVHHQLLLTQQHRKQQRTLRPDAEQLLGRYQADVAEHAIWQAHIDSHTATSLAQRVEARRGTLSSREHATSEAMPSFGSPHRRVRRQTTYVSRSNSDGSSSSNCANAPANSARPARELFPQPRPLLQNAPPKPNGSVQSSPTLPGDSSATPANPSPPCLRTPSTSPSSLAAQSMSPPSVPTLAWGNRVGQQQQPYCMPCVSNLVSDRLLHHLGHHHGGVGTSGLPGDGTVVFSAALAGRESGEHTLAELREELARVSAVGFALGTL